MSKFKDKLSKMVDSIKEGLVDFSSLEVTTLNGEISHFIDADGKFDVSEINKVISGKGANDIKISVVAHTHMAFDQDTILFTKSGMDADERELFEMHVKMVDTAKASRLAFLRLIKDVLD